MKRLVIIPSETSGFGSQSLPLVLQRSSLSSFEAAFVAACVLQLTSADQPGQHLTRREGKEMLDQHLRELLRAGEIFHDLQTYPGGRDALVPKTARAVSALNLVSTIRAGTPIAQCQRCHAVFTGGSRSEQSKFCSKTCKTGWNNALKLGKEPAL